MIMLTQNDLRAIQKLINTEGDSIKGEIKASLKDEIDNSLDRKLKPIKKDIRKIRKDVGIVITMFNRDDT